MPGPATVVASANGQCSIVVDGMAQRPHAGSTGAEDFASVMAHQLGRAFGSSPRWPLPSSAFVALAFHALRWLVRFPLENSNKR